MPCRLTPLITDEYYHIFNRGVAKMLTFYNAHDYKRFLKTMQYYQIDDDKTKLSIASLATFNFTSENRLVDIITYCLMPNHFHLLLRQRKDNGISLFMRTLINSYTKYINVRYDRVGPLFQGPFKAVHITKDEQLLHVNRYIHINPTSASLVKNLEDYPWSSYNEYINQINGMCEKEIITNQFQSIWEYKNFIHDNIGYAQSLEIIKHTLIDES